MAEATGLRNNALPYPIYGQPWGVVFPMLDADGDLVTGATTPDAEVSKNGDTFADCTNESTEIATGSGVYYLLLTATEMTADVVAVIAKSATAGMKTTVITLYPRKLVTLRTGTAAGGAAGSITLDSGASAVDDFYNGCVVAGVLDSTNEVRVITDYTGSTKVASVTPNWNTTPDSDDTFTVYLPEGRQIEQADVTLFGGAAGTFSGGRPEVNTTHAAGTAWGSGAITAGALATGAITNAKFAAGAIDAAAIAADAITDAKVASDVTIASVTGAVGSVTGAVGSVTGNVGGNVTGSVGSVATGGITSASFAAGAIDASAIADGAIDAATFAAGAITATVIATDAIGADEVSAAAVTKIQAGLSTHSAADVWTSVTRTLTAATNITSTGGTTVPQTGDSFARLGAPAGTSVSADVAAVKSDTGATKAKTDSLTFTVAGQVDANIESVNAVTVNGAGTAGNPWGP